MGAKDIVICCVFLVAIWATMRSELHQRRALVRPKSVPRILHQTWFGDFERLGPEKRRLIESCRSLHERAGWKYVLWTLNNISSVHGHRSTLFNQAWFDQSRATPNLQSDISRYEILYEHGGVYVDIDSECLRPFDDLGSDMGEHECYAGIEADWGPSDYPEFKHGLIASGTIGCVPRSRTMLANIVALESTDKSQPPWISAGPYHFTKTMEKYGLPVRALPFWVFYPFHHKGPKNHTLALRSHAIHHWGTTHSNYGVR